MGDRLSREIPSFDCSHAVAAVGRPSPTRAIRPTREEHLSVVATIEDDWYRVSRASGFPTKRRKSRSRQTLGGAGDRGEQGVGRNVLGAPYHETEAKRLTTTQRVNKTVLEAQRRDAEAKQAATTEDDLLHALGSLDATDLRWLLENTAQDSGVFSEDQNVSGQSAGEDKSTMTAPDEQVLPFETLPKDNDVFSRNQNTGVQSRSAQSTIQHHNPTTITGQTVISNEISEQNLKYNRVACVAPHLHPIYVASTVYQRALSGLLALYTYISTMSQGPWSILPQRDYLPFAIGNARFTIATGVGQMIPWDFVSSFAENMLEWTQQGFVGFYDAYYVSVETGQRFFVQLRIAAGDASAESVGLLGDVPDWT
ncbi:hypothetical protein P7C71_g2331, partial [Lecanoromycetidae sp. Uapishka_2]